VTSPQEGRRGCIFIIFLVITIPFRLAVFLSSDVIGIGDVIATIRANLVVGSLFFGSPEVCNRICSRSPCSSHLFRFLHFFHLNFTLFFLYRFIICLFLLILHFLHFLSS
ncbi:hypothetical protein PFISCL1PPCAC_2360, partial [Pristionchus fissidentatus]